MIRSRAETFALILRAGRGAGLPQGLAEEAALAAVVALASDPACGPSLVEALQAPFDPAGCSVADGTLSVTPSPAAWVAPLIRDALADGVACVLVQGVDCPALLVAGLPGTRMAWRGADCTITGNPGAGPVRNSGPLTVDQDTWDTLAALAARRLVPETAASRLSGAGAGGPDAD